MTPPLRCIATIAVVLAAAVLAPRSAAAQPAPDGGPVAAPDGGAPDGAPPADTGLSDEDRRRLEEALKADGVAQAARAAPAAAPVSTLPGVAAAFGRVIQSLNPDISGIVDFAGGFYSGPGSGEPRSDALGPGLLQSGDDPAQTGANLQELELAFSATVDPYFRGDIYLTIPNLAGVEVEEAFLTTTSLPGSLQLKAGMMRTAFGRQNTQHLHVQDFVRRPQMNALFLGDDGMRAPGAELSWLVPLPFYLLVTGGAYSVAPPEDAGARTTFGGGERKDLTYLGNLRTFIPFSDASSLLLGASFATGLTAERDAATAELLAPHRSYLFGGDAYFKWKPPNVSETWMMLTWQTEYYLRHVPDENILEGALYSQIAWRVARRWVIGLRGEIDGIPEGPSVVRQYAGSGSITWNLSEFARARVHAEARYTPSAEEKGSYAAFFQLEASIGAHGAHPY